MKTPIPFTKPDVAEKQIEYLAEVGEAGAPWGGNYFYQKAVSKLEELTSAEEVFLTQSCTAALELAAIGIDVGEGDEFICPSYTFVTSASAFSMRGAKPVFVDIDPMTMNLSAAAVESAISERTKAIVAVHYGGTSCELREIRNIAFNRGIYLIEDAAQAIDSYLDGKHLGTFGHLGCLSFHGTKNLSAGEGGALVINEYTPSKVKDRIRVAHEKGTNRTQFLRGEADKYTWRGPGSSFIPSEFTSAVLFSQLEIATQIKNRRLNYWSEYAAGIQSRKLDVRIIEVDLTQGNAHMFSLILPDRLDRSLLIKRMNQHGIYPTSHYEPLHLSPYVREMWPKQNELPITENLSKRILRLPMWSSAGLDVDRVVAALSESM